MKIFFVLIVLLIVGGSFLLLPAPGSGQERISQPGNRSEPASVAGELLVQFRSGTDERDEARALGRANVERLEDLTTAPMRAEGRGNLVLVRHQPDLPRQTAIQALKDDPAVEFAEPNWIYTHSATSNDPYYRNGSKLTNTFRKLSF